MFCVSFDENWFILNPSKTGYMSFQTHQRRRVTLNNLPTVRVNDSVLEIKNETTLGVILDGNLSWDLQV
jgi:hypothetical protein